jgi:hypothetical protein
MQSHPLKALFIPFLAALGMTLFHAATLDAYTYDTENKTGYDSGYGTEDNAEAGTPHNTDYQTSYGTGPITPLIGPPDEAPIGPAAVFHEILQALSRKSDSQNERIKELRAAVPGILPVLRRAFLVL